MDRLNAPTEVSRDAILKDLIGLLQEITSDWDFEFSGPIGGSTRLVGDLAFESIDVVQLVVAIEERYRRRDFPFERLLMQDGRYVEDVRVAEIADFLARHLGASEVRA
jgi:acyl carrier protein